MTTASTHMSITGRLRIVVVSGALAVSILVSAVSGTLASGGDELTPTAVASTSEQFDVSGADGLVGLTARVVAGGDGVNLRATAAHDAEVLASVPDGTVVSLRIDMVDTVYDEDGTTRWWPVSVSGQDGWISGFYLTDADAFEASDGTDGTTSLVSNASRTPYDYTGSMTAEISADGDGLVLRAEPDRNSASVASLAEGTIVDLQIDRLDTVYDEQGTRWWPVAVDGLEGWVSGFYLIEPGTAASQAPSSRDATTVFFAGDLVRVSTPSGQGLVARVDPSPDSDRLTSLQEDQEVQILGGPGSYEGSTNGWFLVSTGDVTGYVDGDLLVLVTPAEPDVPVAGPDGLYVAGDWAEIRTGDGEGVSLRAGASADSDQSGFAPNQALVEILSGPENGWYEVRWDRQVGYIDGSLLIPADPPMNATESARTETEVAPSSAATEGRAERAMFRSGDYGKVDAGSDVGVNIRENPEVDAERTGFLPEGSIVQITDGPEADTNGEAWYRITDGGQDGWVRGDLLVLTDAPASAEDAAAEADTGEEEAEVPDEADAASGFILPLSKFTFTQDYGCSSLGFYPYDPAFGCSIHDGVDLATASGTPIKAVDSGTVVASGWCDCGLGYYVEIDHGSGLHTVYGHMASQPFVSVGQEVSQGDVIGPVGSTGLSTGPHTHFMVRQDGVTQDPKNYLPSLN